MKKEEYKKFINDFNRALNDKNFLNSLVKSKWFKDPKRKKEFLNYISNPKRRKEELLGLLEDAMIKTKNIKPAQTKGQKKLFQYLQDLHQNENFIKDLSALKSRMGLGLNLSKKEKDISYKKFKEKSIEFAEKYGVDFTHQLFSFAPYKDFAFQGDVCLITDNDEKKQSPSQDLTKKCRNKAYPISINLHKLTTKEDLLDFIEKRWFKIEVLLNSYRKDINPRIRKRNNTKRDEIVWKNKNKKPEEIIKLLSKNGINQGLIDNDIYKIISIMKKRREKNPEI